MNDKRIKLASLSLDRSKTNLREGVAGDLKLDFEMYYSKSYFGSSRGYILSANVVFVEHAKENEPAFEVTFGGWGNSVLFTEAARFGRARLEKEAKAVTPELVSDVIEKIKARKGISLSERGVEQLKIWFSTMNQ